MIDLTRLNGHAIVVNCDLIRFVEATPDTTLTLINGERLIVRETCAQLVTLIAQWRAHILQSAWPDAAQALSARIAKDPVQLTQPSEDASSPIRP
jgi:flagellar protein FlbD